MLRGISGGRRVDPRTTDHVPVREILSSKIVAAAFSAQGLNSEFVMRAMCFCVMTSSYKQAIPQQEETNETAANQSKAAARRRGASLLHTRDAVEFVSE